LNESVPSLDLDLSYHQYRDGPKRLHVVLRATPLAHLIEDARKAYRVHELFAIRRPGDIWKYLHVHPVFVAPDVEPRLERARERAAERMRSSRMTDQLGSHFFGRDVEWLKGAIPFEEFDNIFFWAWDDTEPVDECWRTAAEGDAVRAFCQGCFDWAKRAQLRLRESHDPLIRHEIRLLDSAEHASDWIADTPRLPTGPEYMAATAPTFSWRYYSRLTELLADPAVNAVSYVGRPDYHTLRLIFTEQRRRAAACRQADGEELQLSILATESCDCSSWGGRARWYEEGIGYGDLCVRDADHACTALARAIEHRPNRFGRWILSPQDCGVLDGFAREQDESCCLYSRTTEQRPPPTNGGDFRAR
jgi:hypothetical protein